jgi:hypothetical protein
LFMLDLLLGALSLMPNERDPAKKTTTGDDI